MAYQKGLALLLKIYNGTSFVTLGGMTRKGLTVNAETVDVTNSDSANRWRELLAGAGVKSARVAGTMKFSDAASDALIVASVMANTHVDWQVVVPGLGTFEGAFQISSYEFSGEHADSVECQIQLDSAGEITFTAE